MKLLYISVFPPELGGISEFSERNLKLLENENIELVKGPFTGFLSVFKILLQTFSINPDIIRAEYNFPTLGFFSLPLFFGLYLYKCFNKAKLWVNYHEVKRELDMLGPIGMIIYKLYSAIFDEITVHTNEAKNLLINRCGISESKIEVVPHGIYVTKESPVSIDEINKKYKLEDSFLILLFGFIHIDKGFDYVLDAIKIIKDKNPEVYESLRVVIAGDVRERNLLFKPFEKKDHNYKKLLYDKSNEYNINEHVLFTGYLGKETVYPFLKRADIFVLPYTNTEQSGVLNQIIPFDKPIIASNIGGLGETLSGYGILVEPKDSESIANEIMRLVSDKSYYEKIQKEYLILAETISLENVKRSYLDIINNLWTK
jgi:glycosyltransferase involved in cell wall biosynthesis